MSERTKTIAYCILVWSLWLWPVTGVVLWIPIKAVTGWSDEPRHPYKMKHYDSELHQDYLDDRASSSYRGY